LWDISRLTSQITHDWKFENLSEKSSIIKKICTNEDLELEIDKIKESKNFFVVDKDRLHRNRKKIQNIEEKLSSYGCLAEKYGKVHPIRHPKRDKKSLAKSYYRYFKRVLGNETKRRKRHKSKYIFIPTSWEIGRVDRAGIGTRIKKIHTEEYDEYILSEENKNEFEKVKAIFIDQAIPNHAGMKKKYGEEWVEEKKYYEEVEEFLSKLERQNKMKKKEIKISAHPKRNKNRLQSFFKNRKVKKGKTPEMIRNSKIVVTHSSTAALYAAMGKKDTCFFSVESISDTEEHENAKNMAKIFGRELNTNDEKKIDYGKDKTKYKKLMEKFVKAKGTPHVNSWVYVYNTLVK
jgi:hypothetical protein